MNTLQPHEGQWYAVRDNGQIFCVINVDADDEIIDIQDFEGAIDEIDFEEWEGLDLEMAAEPEDEDGALDDSDDTDVDRDTRRRRSDWGENLQVRRLSGDEWPDSDSEGSGGGQPR
jgi:hypothetical protein